MPISAPSPRPDTQYDYTSRPSPDAAGIVSFLLPGLGQIWGGERRKGVLFMAAHTINLAAVLTLVFSPWILKSLESFGQANEMRLNQQLSKSFIDLGFGSPASIILALLLLSFALFAARDAFDHSARLKRQSIYHDYVLAMPEATSGSYIFHASFLLACLVLAFFFLIPPAPQAQLTVIEFTQNQENTKQKPITQKRAEHNSSAAGKHDPSRPTEKAAARPAHQVSKSSAAKAESTAEKKSETKTETKTESKNESKAESKTEAKAAAPSQATPAKAVPTPQPQPQPQAHSISLPKPATMAPGAIAPRPSFPAVTPTVASLPASAQTPLLPLPPVAKATGQAPAPVAVGKMTLAMAGTSAPQPMSPGKAAGTPAIGGPSAIAVTTAQNSGTDSGAASHPVPVGVRSGKNSSGSSSSTSGDPNESSHSGPAPRKGSDIVGERSGGPLGSIGTPRLVRGGPGEGSHTNPAGGPREGDSDPAAAEIDWGPYMAALQRRIKSAWYPPRGPVTKMVKVIFTLSTNGELSNLKLLLSSGQPIVDRAALKAVEDSAPFRPLPAHAPRSVDIEFTFDYNVFGGGSLR